MFDQLKDLPRLLLKQELKPVQGDRFQPTGFANLGPAVYETHDGTPMLLVESAQSVANHLEKTCRDGETIEAAGLLKGLPYVRVKLTGGLDSLTTSLVEPHRLNSPFIIGNKRFESDFVAKAEYEESRAPDWRKIALAVLHYDPSSLVHGLFMAKSGLSRIRIPRALTGFIEAVDVREAVSGGVKNSLLDPSGDKIRVEGYADKDVYSNVPYARREFTAREIAAYFNLDLALLIGYGLPDDGYEFLVALALYKVRRFLDGGLRLRTACDLRAEGAVQVQAPPKFDLPTEAELLAAVREGIRACTQAGLFAAPPVTELTTTCVVKTEKTAAPTK